MSVQSISWHDRHSIIWVLLYLTLIYHLKYSGGLIVIRSSNSLHANKYSMNRKSNWLMKSKAREVEEIHFKAEMATWKSNLLNTEQAEWLNAAMALKRANWLGQTEVKDDWTERDVQSALTTSLLELIQSSNQRIFNYIVPHLQIKTIHLWKLVTQNKVTVTSFINRDMLITEMQIVLLNKYYH